MALPINIEELIHGQAIEWDRLEFKKGWNPEEILHTICAFANDINNWGGGYIIVGIEDNDGRPVFPPIGINYNQIDAIQGELVKICHQIKPNYIPVVQPYYFQEKHILVIWVPAGDIRPYSAPSTQGKNARWQSYIRFGGRSIIAMDENLRRLQELTARIPFDDRINNRTSVKDFDFGLIRSFLQEIKSDLFEESTQIPFNDLCRLLHIAKGSDEDLRPVNAGLLFFTNNPEIYFDRAWIEVVIRKDEYGDDYTEKYFKGPLHHQLRNSLNFIKDQVIVENVKKITGRAEADRFYNFPFDAVEEALSNAVYHKSYDLDKPIEIQIWSDRIEILSFPGPVPPVNAEILASQQRIVARDYRNRRIGDFLKELHLTEGRGTGISKIYGALERNGSPKPLLETDSECNYFLYIIYAHSDTSVNKLKNDQPNDQAILHHINNIGDFNYFIEISNDQADDQAKSSIKRFIQEHIHDKVELILLNLLGRPTKRAEILENIGLKNHTDNRKKYLDPLLDLDLVEMTIPDKPTHQDQKYRITAKGKKLTYILGN